MPNDNVLELVAEEEQLPLEKVIDNTLVKHNVTDAVIAAMKQKYGGLRLRSVDNKEDYLEIKAARKEVRKIGILTETLCKKGREDAIAAQRKWLTKEKEILSKINEVQYPLDSEIDRYEKEIELREFEAAKKREEIFSNRQAALYKMGAAYVGGSIELRHISYEVELIKQADEETWELVILSKYKKVYEEIEAARVAEENRRKHEAEVLAIQREEFEAQKKAFRDQQDELERKRLEMLRQQEELERQQRLEKEKKESKLISDRLAQLDDVKWNGMFAFRGDESNPAVDRAALLEMSDETFSALAATHNGMNAQLKAKAEKERQDKIAEDIRLAKEQAAQQERERIEREQREAEQRRLEELAMSGDKSMYADVVKYLSNYPKHGMKSNIYKGKMNTIAHFIQNL